MLLPTLLEVLEVGPLTLLDGLTENALGLVTPLVCIQTITFSTLIYKSVQTLTLTLLFFFFKILFYRIKLRRFYHFENEFIGVINMNFI